MNYTEAEPLVYPLAFEIQALSGGLGTANHVGVGDGLSATAFDWPRILVLFFNEKVQYETAVSKYFSNIIRGHPEQSSGEFFKTKLLILY